VLLNNQPLYTDFHIPTEHCPLPSLSTPKPNKQEDNMKQAVLDLKSFVVCPSKKILRKHKRIVGISPLTAAKNAEKKRKAKNKCREQEQKEHDHQVQKWHDFLAASDTVDQQSKNPAACFAAYGPAPSPCNSESE
jgi:hypothetical protein